MSYRAAWRAWRVYRLLLIVGQLILIGIVLHRPSTHPIIWVFAVAGMVATLRRIGRRRWRW
jgi:hypothetical protein